MNIFEKIIGKKSETQEKSFDFAQKLSELHKEALSVDDLEKQPFAKDLMSVISKVNRGLNFIRNEEAVCYLVDKLKMIDGNVGGSGRSPSYDFIFSLKDIKAGKLDTLSLEYAKHTEYPEGKLWINDGRKVTAFSEDKLSNENSDFHFANANQGKFFEEIKNTISKFIEDQEKKEVK